MYLLDVGDQTIVCKIADYIYAERGLLGTVEIVERLRFLGYDYRRYGKRVYFKRTRHVNQKQKQQAGLLFRVLDEQKDEVLKILALDDQMFGKSDTARIKPKMQSNSIKSKESVPDISLEIQSENALF